MFYFTRTPVYLLTRHHSCSTLATTTTYPTRTASKSLITFNELWTSLAHQKSLLMTATSPSSTRVSCRALVRPRSALRSTGMIGVDWLEHEPREVSMSRAKSLRTLFPPRTFCQKPNIVSKGNSRPAVPHDFPFSSLATKLDGYQPVRTVSIQKTDRT